MDNVNTDDYADGFTPVAVNTVFSTSGEAYALNGLSPATGTAPDHLAEFGSVYSGNLVLENAQALASGLEPPIYSDYYGFEIVSGGGILTVTYPEPRVLTRMPPVARVTNLTIGTLTSRTGVLLSKDGLFSVPQYFESPGISVAGPVGAGVYLTRPDGKDFYRVGSIGPSGTSEVTSPEFGAVLPDRSLRIRPIPLRGPITLNNSRLFSGIGSSVYYSEPFVFNASTVMSFYQFPGPVIMVAGIDKHLFVGTRRGVWFVTNAGSTKQASVRKVSDAGVLSHSFVRPPTSEMGMPVPEVVAWMSTSGIQLGSADGSVLTPKAGKVKLEGPVDGVLTYHQRKFFYYKRG